MQADLSCWAWLLFFMYFEVQTDGLYERMKYPVIIRSTGMMMLYSLIPTYATQRMPYKFLSSWICTMITIRMVIAPSLGAAVYTNALQERQQNYVTRYAQDIDLLHPDASASFMSTVRGMSYQGKSKAEASEHGSHVRQGTCSGTGHFGCSQGNGRLDTLCLSGHVQYLCWLCLILREN